MNDEVPDGDRRLAGSASAGFPDPIGALGDLAPAFQAGYLAARSSVMEGREGGLSPGMKEVVLMVIDVVLGNEEAAVFHGTRALEEGIGPEALLEGLLLVFLLAGAATWGKTGQAVHRRVLGARGTTTGNEETRLP